MANTEVHVEDKKRSAVDVSRELIIDSIVLTKEVLHSIQNSLPIPLNNIMIQPIDSTAELASYERPEPSMRLLVLTILLVLATVGLLTLH